MGQPSYHKVGHIVIIIRLFVVGGNRRDSPRFFRKSFDQVLDGGTADSLAIRSAEKLSITVSRFRSNAEDVVP